MTKLSWNERGSRFYEAGVDRGVLYPKVGPGVPWNGLTSIKETTTDTIQRITHVDGQKVRTQLQLGIFEAEVLAFTYPKEFEAYDGLGLVVTGQPRQAFNLSYRTTVGSDTTEAARYKIHLVYNATAQPSSKAYLSESSSQNLTEFSWILSTLPVIIPGANPASHFIIDSAHIYPEAMTILEDILYGTENFESKFPTIEELLQIFEDTAILKIVDYGDGTWSATGPDDVVSSLDATSFQISWPSATYVDDSSYTIKSL